MQSHNLVYKPSNKMTLRSKINWLVLLIIIIVIALVTSVNTYMFINTEFQDTGQQALKLADTVASMPEIVRAFNEADPSANIQPITKDIMSRTGAQFIVVANMTETRYSHPNPALIGKTMDPDPGDDKKVLAGQESITEAMGSLGLSVRGKAPIFNAQHHQIGIVSVGFLVSDIWNKILVFLLRTAGLGVIALILGLWGAHLLSGHIKKQIFNMEPFEIALLSQEQASILQAIREGIIAVDSNGRITTCNQEAQRLLGLESSEVVGKFIHHIIPNSRLLQVLEEGLPQSDQTMIIGNSLAVVNRVPVSLNGQIIGAVASFRDKIQLEQIDQHLADVGRYADALRSQRHEFMNRIHTISGLIRVQEYDLVHELIDQINSEQQQLLDFFMGRIRDAAVVGILIGKIHRAKELSIALTVDPQSYLSDHCSHREIIVTALGNAIENAIEAMIAWDLDTRTRSIIVYLNDQTDHIHLTVTDSGPGVDTSLKNRIFEDGVSTKGAGRGFGLALVSRLVSSVGGDLAVVSSGEGASLQVTLPKSQGQNNRGG